MRVIAGSHGGRRLRAPAGRAVRPTPDRVREALFSALGPLDGLAVLDLYAGSGALGIEALSRGAARLVLVERSRAALTVLRDNLEALELAPRATVIAADVAQARAGVLRHGPYELILADPPYADAASGRVSAALSRLLAAPAPMPGARLVLEHAKRDAPPTLEGWETGRTRRYGDTALSFYRWADPPSEPLRRRPRAETDENCHRPG